MKATQREAWTVVDMEVFPAWAVYRSTIHRWLKQLANQLQHILYHNTAWAHIWISYMRVVEQFGLSDAAVQERPRLRTTDYGEEQH